MSRVVYERGEIDSHHQILDGISRTLRQSHRGCARTTLQAVQSIEVLDNDGQAMDADLNGKIAYICEKLNCTHELLDDEIVFTRQTDS